MSSPLNKFSPVPVFTIGMSKKNVLAFFEISSKTNQNGKTFLCTSVITFITKDRKRLFCAHLYNFVLKTGCYCSLNNLCALGTLAGKFWCNFTVRKMLRTQLSKMISNNKWQVVFCHKITKQSFSHDKLTVKFIVWFLEEKNPSILEFFLASTTLLWVSHLY